MNRPRVIQVIESEVRRGCGGSQACRRDHVHELVRLVTQYHTFDGELLAEHDPTPPHERACP